MVFFENVNKNFGFVCMRLPEKNGVIDYVELNRMVDYFIDNGFNYFDTARGYHEGKSEIAVRECLSKRYPRDKYILTDKLTGVFFNSHDEIRPFFESQLVSCGVEYFDFYLMHSQTKELFEKFKKCKAYETAFELKNEGKIKHVGLSFHDKAEVLDEILNEYPQVEVVQIQLNYVDYNDAAVQSKLCYDVCVKHNKPVIVMEPVKGGSLANLPEEGKKILSSLGGGSAASYAIRFAAGFENVFMTLSGMSNFAQLKDNISFMKEFKPLDEREKKAINEVCEIIKSKHLIPCTACRYCVEGCPKNISIPDLFSCLNAKKMYRDWNSDYYYDQVYTVKNGKASDCVKCGKCEKVCPQHLKIRELLKTVAETFEKAE